MRSSRRCSRRNEHLNPNPQQTPKDDYGQVPEQGVIQYERLLPGPIERVWTFLTCSKERGTWLAEGDLELREGAPCTLYFFHASLSPVKETILEKYLKQFEGGWTHNTQLTHV